jgi:hypothetical protein
MIAPGIELASGLWRGGTSYVHMDASFLRFAPFQLFYAKS